MALGMLDKNDAAKAIMTPVNNRILTLRDQIEDYARQRSKYVRAGGGTPPPGATPVAED